MPNFNFLTTHVGSVPHKDPVALTHRLAGLLDIPAWLQLPRRNYLFALTPNCALDSTTVEIAEEVFDKMAEMGKILQRG